MAHYDDLDTKQIWTVGLVSAVLTGVTILAVQVLYFALLNSFESSKLADTEYTSSIQHIALQKQRLASYGVDPETKKFHMPIDRAMKLFVQEQAETEKVDEKVANTEEGASA